MHRFERRQRLLAIGMATLAGFVDALGYLQLRGFFVSFMSGNSTRMSIGLASDRSAAIVGGALVALFVAGVVVGTIVARMVDARRPVVVLLLVAVLLAVAAVLASAGHADLAIACMTLAMGAENTVFERDGEVAIGVTYMTGALVKTGQHLVSAFLGGDRWAWAWQLGLWAGLVVGAAIGAKAFDAFSLGALWIAASSAVILAIFARALTSRDERRETV